MQIRGRVWKYGDDINTDVIFPGKYTYTATEAEDIAAHALEDLDPDFARNVRPGDVIVAGRNWGCGSSREQAATCLKLSGVGALVAGSFARIFYRNAINAGLPAIACPEAVQAVKAGDEVTIDLEAGEIRAGKETFGFPPFPAAVREILDDGGLIPHLRRTIEPPDQEG